MSYKMSYKVRSLFFFFGFVIAAVVYNGIEEQPLSPTGETLEERQEVNTNQLSDLDTGVATTVANIE